MGLTVYDANGRPKSAVRGPDMPMDTWHYVGDASTGLGTVFTGGWVANSGPTAPRFRKYPDGRARIVGAVKSGANGSGVFQLPVGYRPPIDLNLPIVGSGGTAYLTVYANGVVLPTNFTANVSAYCDLNVEWETETVLTLPGGPMGPIGTPPRVTALPTSGLYDGREVYFVADAVNGILWHLRYNAASSYASKWELVGGRPLVAQVDTNDTASGTAYVDTSPTAGPSLVLPLAGDYDVEFGAQISSNTVGTSVWVAIKLGAAATGDGDAINVSPPTTTAGLTTTRSMRRTALAAGATLKMQLRTSANIGGIYFRRLAATPVRVS